MMNRRVAIGALLMLAAIGANALSLRGTGRALLESPSGHGRQLTTFGAEVVVGSGKGGKKVVQKEVVVAPIIEYQPVKVVAKKTKKPKKKDVKKVLDRTAKRIARADAHVAHVIAATENISKKKVAEAEFADSVAATAVQVDALTGPLILPAVAAGAAVVSAKAKADDVINYNSISAKKIAKAIKKAEKAKAKAKRKAAKQIAAIQEYYAEQISYAKVAYLPFTGKAVKSGGKKAAPGIFLPPVLASAPTLGPQAIPYLLKGVHDGAGPAPVLRVLSNFDEDAINDLNGLFIGDGAGLLPPSAAEHLVLPVDLPDFDLVKAVGQLKACAKAALEGLVEGTAQPGKGGLPAPLPAGLVRTLVDLNPGI